MHRFRFVTALTLFAFLLISSLSKAAVPTFDKERQLFLQAESLISENKITEYKKVRSQLDAYPLAVYLDYDYMIKKLGKQSNQSIQAFINTNADTPLANRLNRTWLNHLARTQQWKRYKSHFDANPVDSTRYICQYNSALYGLKGKHRQAALKAAKELWLVGSSQPKQCNPLFKAWMATGRPTSQEAATRFWLTVENDEIKLARYLEKKVTSKEHKAQIEDFWKIYNDPASISKKGLKRIPEEFHPSIIRMAYKKWFKKESVAAANSWLKYRDYFLPKDQQIPVTEYMATRFNFRYSKTAMRYSQKLDPNYELPELTERRIRTALAQQNWKAVHEAISHLPESEKQDSKWKYWDIVAQTHINPKHDPQAALAKLAEDRSYYGFLAAELNKSPFQLNAISSQPSQNDLVTLESKPSVMRAKELFILGRLTEANREWNLAQRQMSDAEKLTAGYVAKSWDWHLQAIINAAKTQRWDHVDLRFPHPHAKLFQAHAKKNDLDLSFPVAIARQESAFLFNATSRVGARGLMQLMPQTATNTAKKHNVPFESQSELFNPETNITLGAAYLGDMFKMFNSNPAYAAAAYNAGPHRVTKWLKARGKLPLDIWIETIPFTETRKYVQSVLAYRVIYDRLEGRDPMLLSADELKQITLLKNKKIAF